MPNTRDLNFQLSDLEEGPVRDHFIEVQEVHEEGKIGDLYALGFGVFTETVEVPATGDLIRQVPGEIVLLTGRMLLDTGVSLNMNFSNTTDNTHYNASSSGTPYSLSVFIIYKRP